MTSVSISTVLLIAIVAYLLGKNHDKIVDALAKKCAADGTVTNPHWTQMVQPKPSHDEEEQETSSLENSDYVLDGEDWQTEFSKYLEGAVSDAERVADGNEIIAASAVYDKLQNVVDYFAKQSPDLENLFIEYLKAHGYDVTDKETIEAKYKAANECLNVPAQCDC